MSRAPGYKHTEESKQKMRDARANRVAQQTHSSETRAKIGKGSARTRNAEKMKCPYQCGMVSNNGAIRRHVLKEHEFVCRVYACGATQHKGRGLCHIHHSIDVAMAKYSLTVDDYIEQFYKQNGRCKTCNKAVVMKGNTSGKRSDVVHIDHCHTSNDFRGLICYSCNIALGHVKDSIQTLLNLAKYLEGTL